MDTTDCLSLVTRVCCYYYLVSNTDRSRPILPARRSRVESAVPSYQKLARTCGFTERTPDLASVQAVKRLVRCEYNAECMGYVPLAENWTAERAAMVTDLDQRLNGCFPRLPPPFSRHDGATAAYTLPYTCYKRVI